MSATARTPDWGRKAADLYQPSYAREYRHHDDELGQVAAYEAFCAWLPSPTPTRPLPIGGRSRPPIELG